jgi:uncharacterized protein (TIGR02594 family)
MPVSPSWQTPANRHIRYSERRATALADLATAGSGRRSRFANDPRLAQASANFTAAQSHSNSAYGGVTNDPMVNEARRYIGTNPTGRGSQWCGAFMDMVLRRTGHPGGGNLAWGYSRYGRRIVSAQVGAIAVMHGHVGVVSGIDANGNPIIVSGNHNHTVAESVYPRGRIVAYVLPN